VELIVFDLDGTLLNRKSEISVETKATLQQLKQRGIAYTVATGRTLHAARNLLDGHDFTLPQVFKNGVMIWQPDTDTFSHSNLLTLQEIGRVLKAFSGLGLSPFIFTVEDGNRHGVYYPPPQSDAERGLIQEIVNKRGLPGKPLAEIPASADITNISAIGPQDLVRMVEKLVIEEPHLVAYAGTAIEGQKLHWIDIHHSSASKGGAITQLKHDLGISRVICFGDSDNDLSMFELADESYAPSNAKDVVKQAATQVIGHHDEDGIALFLRERFKL
jgi:Cof subfamily protein (haloacid dehalogenase superfamily)